MKSFFKGAIILAAGLAVGVEASQVMPENQVGEVKAEADKAHTIMLVKDASPVATIIIAKDANRAARFAAAELQWHIEKITGAKLPIATDEEKITGPRILVGESGSTKNLGLHNKDFKHQEYLIRFRPDTLVLMGKDKEDKEVFDYSGPATFPGSFDEQATSYAVYDFLEKHCGVRWYLPTELGLVCPRQKTLSVNGTEMRREASMKYRALSHADLIAVNLCDEPGPLLEERERWLFLRRQRLAGIQPYACNHALYGYYDLFLEKKPEWFAQGYDKDMPEEMRRKIDGSNREYRKYYPNMCYTNKEFIQHVIERADDYFKTGHLGFKEVGAGDYFSLGPMDSSGQDKMCQCPECQKLIHKEAPCNMWRKQQFFFDDKNSDYIFGFVNKVAREVGKTHPGKYLTMFAYHQTYYPPTREPLEPNVAITFCIHAQLRPIPAMDRAVTELLNKWDEESKERPKYLWLYFHRPGRANPFFPGFMAHDMVKQMEDYYKRGFRGIFAEPAPIPRKKGEAKVEGAARRAPIVNMLELYIAYKLAYDSTLDGNKLIDEFFALYYGNAGKAMQALYEKIEQAYCDPSNYLFAPNSYFGYQTEKIAWEKLGTKKRMAEFGKLMEEAKLAAKTEIEKKRVELFEKNVWERMKAGKKEYEKLKAQGKISDEKVEQMD